VRAGTLATAAAAAGIFIKMGEELCGAEAVREDEQNYKKKIKCTMATYHFCSWHRSRGCGSRR